MIDQYQPKHFVMEFDKVLLDVFRAKSATSNYSREYTFADGYSSTPEFNFSLLENYLLTLDKPKDN